jgi:Tfp pilus assembly protein PilE
MKKTQKNFRGGFMTLIGVLIVVLIIGIWFVKAYSGSNAVNKKTQMDTYNGAIKDAENAKKLLEQKSDLDIEGI